MWEVFLAPSTFTHEFICGTKRWNNGRRIIVKWKLFLLVRKAQTFSHFSCTLWWDGFSKSVSKLASSRTLGFNFPLNCDSLCADRPRASPENCAELLWKIAKICHTSFHPLDVNRKAGKKSKWICHPHARDESVQRLNSLKPPATNLLWLFTSECFCEDGNWCNWGRQACRVD